MYSGHYIITDFIFAVLQVVFLMRQFRWIFLCDEIALPEIWKSDVRKVEII